MSLDTITKMRELKLKSEDPKPNCTPYEDSDICRKDEIDTLFQKCESLLEPPIAIDNEYILHIAGTLETNPNVAISLSNNTCEVYNLSNNQVDKLAVLAEHTDVITEIKFSTENSNLLYSGSCDGTVRLWDIRAPKRSSVQFKDTTVMDVKNKSFNCFDISPNNKLLAAGTNLFEGDSFILFWDVRKNSLLGGYWVSHTDDITQLKFHPDDSNKLISGSVDGLINLYDLSQRCEEDALLDSLNTVSSIEKLSWLRQGRTDIISCVTHTADVQFWKIEDSQPYYHFHRHEIAKEIQRKSEGHIYVVDVHGGFNKMLVLAGSNSGDGECIRGLSVVGNTVTPALGFPSNKQRVRCSWSNLNLNLLLTGGEKGILNLWDVTTVKCERK
ncbi:WD repeat-containing protein 89 isoform X1 [Tribolium madens]|uniref:WD repeat-containing protein 89 isoform X1 n=1 Tax=Tribolium madens TaxID=41895 RepID=UPI001CF7402A|nr:WD repeat-containing protein 89 isoform X1 [Tribolium madens]